MLTRCQLESQQKNAAAAAKKGGNSSLKKDKGMKYQCVSSSKVSGDVSETDLCIAHVQVGDRQQE